MHPFQTIPEMFLRTTSDGGDRPAYGFKEGGVWKTISFSEARQTVDWIGAGLSSLGTERGDRISILSNNSPRWVMADYGILCNGGVTTSIYPTLTPRQVKYILDDSGSRVVFVENREQAEKVRDVVGANGTLTHCIVMDDDRSIAGQNHLTFSDLQERGRAASTMGSSLAQRVAAVRPEDLLTLIYTSGTTGEPKGVMLTNKNICSNILATVKVIPVESSDVYLSFLPLSHSFERMAGHFFLFSAGAVTFYAENMEKVGENIGEVHPTILAGVPRFYEKLYSRVTEKVAADPKLRQAIFWWAIRTGTEALKYRQVGKPLPAGLSLKHGLADRLVFSKLRARLGGRLRYLVSGAAPLRAQIGEFFGAAGLIILEGYGLTETSPVISISRPNNFRFGAVGLPIDDVEVRIAPDGEILSRGPNTMKGYFRKEEATREAIDPDGWFHTGDIGEFDADGFLRITDRKKSLFKTSGGKYIAPTPLEEALSRSRYVEQCMVIGENRNFVTALVVPNFVALEAFAKDQGIEVATREDLIRDSKVLALFEGEVASTMADFARFETVKRVVLLSKEWTIASEELTPTLKARRKVIEANYQQQIEELYRGSGGWAGER